MATLQQKVGNVAIGNKHHGCRNVKFNGGIDLNSKPPKAVGESIIVVFQTELIVNLLENDSNPDGDIIYIDGISQPDNGRVFDNKDGTVSYHPNLDFTGKDKFKYWVTDKFGNFPPAYAQVTVQD